MIQVETLKSTKSVQSRTELNEPVKGKMHARMFVPISHGSEKTKGGTERAQRNILIVISIAITVLAVGVALWVTGQKQMSPSFLLAGRILIGLALSPFAFIIGCVIVWSPCICKQACDKARQNHVNQLDKSLGGNLTQ